MRACSRPRAKSASRRCSATRCGSMTEEQRNGRFNNIGDPGRLSALSFDLRRGRGFHLRRCRASFCVRKDVPRGWRPTSPGADWLVGKLSLADVSLIPFVARLEYLNLLDVWIADRPRRRGGAPRHGRVFESNCRPAQARSARGDEVLLRRIKARIASRRERIVSERSSRPDAWRCVAFPRRSLTRPSSPTAAARRCRRPRGST